MIRCRYPYQLQRPRNSRDRVPHLLNQIISLLQILIFFPLWASIEGATAGFWQREARFFVMQLDCDADET